MTAARIGVAVAGLLVLGAGAAWLLLGRGDPRDEIAQSSARYLAAWEQREWAEMRALVAEPPADFDELHERALTALEVSDAELSAEAPRLTDDGAVVAFQARLQLAGLGTWRYEGALDWIETPQGWRVDWQPSTLHPELAAGQRLARQRRWPDRAPILDHTGAPITEQRPAVEVGIQGARLEERAEVVTALAAHADVAEAAAEAAVERAAEQPDWFIPVTVLPRPAYDAVRPELYPVPGLVFREVAVRAPPQPGFARHTVGAVGEITAELLDELGEDYLPGDAVGHFGLEWVFERELAGTPEGEVRIVDEAGELVTILEPFAGAPGAPVQTTLDIAVQQAAEAVLDDVERPAALVVLDPDTAAVRAVASRPLDGVNRALAGRYPPGSTFKIVTAAALLTEGLSPDAQVSCPGEAIVGGQRFGNAGGAALGAITFARAFAESCNTAFVQLAETLPPGALAAAAEQLGFGRELPGVPLPAFGGSFPEVADAAEHASAAIGQAGVLASPLQLASVTAAVAAGQWRSPSLLADEIAAPAAGEGAPSLAEAGVLAELMRGVVTDGTGTAAAVSGQQVRGKTGSAEHGPQPAATPTHAWFVGFTDELAFAVLVEEGGGGGGAVAAPLAAELLRALPS